MAHSKWRNIPSRKSTRYQKDMWGCGIWATTSSLLLPCSRSTLRNRTPSAPSAQSQEKQAAFISHPQPSPHPQPHMQDFRSREASLRGPGVSSLTQSPSALHKRCPRYDRLEECLGSQLHSLQLTQRSEFPLQEWHVWTRGYHSPPSAHSERRSSSTQKQRPTFNSAAVVWGFCPDR